MSNDKKIESTEQDSNELELEVKRVKTVKTSLKGGLYREAGSEDAAPFLSLPGSCGDIRG